MAGGAPLPQISTSIQFHGRKYQSTCYAWALCLLDYEEDRLIEFPARELVMTDGGEGGIRTLDTR